VSAPPPISTEHEKIIASAERGARLSDQADDRMRLRDALPEVIICLHDKTSKLVFPKADDLEFALATIWPRDCLISELDEFDAHHQFDDVNVFEIESYAFSREQSQKSDLIAFKMSWSEEETTNHGSYTDGDGNVYQNESTRFSTDDLFILSSKVAVRMNVDNGDHCDDEFDGSMNASIFVSDNPFQMQSLIRQESKKAKFEGLTEDKLEDNLKRIFGSKYRPEEGLVPKIRP
jgi:hypothetical protein